MVQQASPGDPRNFIAPYTAGSSQANPYAILNNLQAGALTSSTLGSLGQVPNPQLVAEALQTNSTPQLMGALQNPVYNHILAANPYATTGGSIPQYTTPAHSNGLVMNQDDWRNYWDRFHNLSGYDNQWKSLGSMPIASVDWMKAVLQSDPRTTRSWQSFLHQQGFSGTDANGKAVPITASGTWDQSSTQAFSEFMISRFLPDALWNANASSQGNARQFLSALGMDPTTFDQMRTDPTQQRRIVQNWMNTHGPDTKLRDTVTEFSDKYGQANMPADIWNLRNDFWSQLADTLGSVPFAGMVLKLPVAAPVEAMRGAGFSWDTVTKAPSEVIAQQESHLNNAESQAFSQALQAAHNTSGWLGFLDNWDQMRSKFTMAAWYTFGDLAQGKLENPFDPMSSAGKGATANWQDPFGSMMDSIHVTDLVGGGKFADRFGILDTIGNIGVSIMDDPLTYLGGLGAVGTGGRLASEFTKIRGVPLAIGGTERAIGFSKTASAARFMMLTPTSIRDAMRADNLASHVLHAFASPTELARKQTAAFIGSLPKSGRGLATLATMLGEDRPEKLPLLQKMLDESNDGVRYSMLQEEYRHKLHSPDQLFLEAETRKRYHPEVWNRLSDGQQLSFLHRSIRTMDNHSAQVMTGDRVAVARQMMDTAMTRPGFDQKQLDQILDKVMSENPNDRADAVSLFRQEYRAALKKDGIDVSALRSWAQHLRSYGRKGRGGDNPTVTYLPSQDESGRVIERSTRSRPVVFDTGDPERDLQLTEHYHELRGQVAAVDNILEDEIQKEIEARLDGAPRNVANERQLRQEIMQDPQFQAREGLAHATRAMLQEKLTGIEGNITKPEQIPTAFTSGQFNLWGRLEFTPYEVLSFNNPKLRAVENVNHATDRLQSVWKTMVLSKLSSALRILGGDETSRFLVKQLTDGGPMALARHLRRTMQYRKRDPAFKLPQDLKQLIAHALTGWHFGEHIPYLPGEEGYLQATTHMFTNIFGKSPEVKAWVKGVKKDGEQGGVAAMQKYLNQDNEIAKEFRARHALNSPELVDQFARNKAQELLAWTKYDPSRTDRSFLFNWLHQISTPEITRKNPISKADVRKFIANHQHDGLEGPLPVVVGRRAHGGGGTGGGIQHLTHAVGETSRRLLDSWIGRAREYGYSSLVEENLRNLETVYGDSRDADWKLSAAQNDASQWVKKNTYQLQRSMLATATRGLFPFWGATANFDRFVLRTWAKHPWTIMPTLRMQNYSQQAQQGQGVRWTMPGQVNALLQHLGVAQGDQVTVDPLHAFFLTSDGYGGWMPGAGPIATAPLRAWAVHNPDVQNAMKQIPGMEFNAYESPLVPWLSDVVDATSMGLRGEPALEGVPFIGRPAGTMQKAIDDMARQQHAQYAMGQRSTDASVGTARQAVVNQQLFHGLASFLLPLQVATQDPQAKAITEARTAYDAAQTPEQKQQVLSDPKFAQARPLLQYFDSGTTPDERLQIAQQYPWVPAYATGITTGQGAEANAASFQRDLQTGRQSYLMPNQLIDKMRKNDEFNDAYGQYRVLRDNYQYFLLSNGITAQDARAALYRNQVYDPGIAELESSHPVWAQTFQKTQDSSVRGQVPETAPLRTLMTWEAIPGYGEQNTDTANAWRQVLSDRQALAETIRLYRLQGRPKTDETVALAQFNQRVQQIAADPKYAGFARQISRYTYQNLDDVVELTAEGIV